MYWQNNIFWIITEYWNLWADHNIPTRTTFIDVSLLTLFWPSLIWMPLVLYCFSKVMTGIYSFQTYSSLQFLWTLLFVTAKFDTIINTTIYRPKRGMDMKDQKIMINRKNSVSDKQNVTSTNFIRLHTTNLLFHLNNCSHNFQLRIISKIFKVTITNSIDIAGEVMQRVKQRKGNKGLGRLQHGQRTL